MNQIAHLTNIKPEEMKVHWDNYMALDGMRVSELDEYQARLVDFFTVRTINNISKDDPNYEDLKDVKYKRVPALYVIPLVNGLGMIEAFMASSIHCAVYEDIQLAMPRIPFETNFIHDESFYSITAEEYKTPRFFMGSKFRRINYRKDKGFYIVDTSNYAAKEEQFSNLKIDAKKATDLNEEDLKYVYAKGTRTGDTIEIDGTTIEMNTFFPPYSETTYTNEVTSSFAVLLFMWSHSPALVPPVWVQQALAYYRENGDEVLDAALLSLGIKVGMGKAHSDYERTREGRTTICKSRTISLAMNLAQRHTGIGQLPTRRGSGKKIKKPVSTKPEPPLGAMDI